MPDPNIGSPRGLPGSTDQAYLVSRSSAPVSRAAALPADEPQSYLSTDLIWVAYEVARRTGVPVRDMRWSLETRMDLAIARRIFYLVAQELTAASTEWLAAYVSRDPAHVATEIQAASPGERLKARDLASAMVIERRKAAGERHAR